MKKCNSGILLILYVVIACSFIGCGKVDPVAQRMIDGIKALGEIEPEDEEKIKELPELS